MIVNAHEDEIQLPCIFYLLLFYDSLVRFKFPLSSSVSYYLQLLLLLLSATF